MKIKKSDVGRAVTVKWDCVGRRDALLVDVDEYHCRIFEFRDKHTTKVDHSQIVEKRDYVNAL